jgi:SAM-dependent methyltransferase
MFKNIIKKCERHLNKKQVIKAIEVCPICRSSNKRFPVTKIQSNPLIEVLYCPNCKGCSASMMPMDTYLQKYYSNYYNESEEKYTFGNITRFAKHIIKNLKVLNNKDELRILDFGGGDGSLSKGIAELILNKDPNLKILVTLCDYQKVESFSNNNLNFISVQNLDEINCTFDLVLAGAVIEHIPDVYFTLKKLFSMVKPGGIFYSRTPYVIPFRKIIKNYPLLYPMHLHDLGPSFWNRILEIYDIESEILYSKPSIVQTEFSEEFFKTLLAYLFKIPAYLEILLRNRPKDLIWKFSGGWEIFLKIYKTKND